jgi:integrase/recombinase XerC
LEYSNWLSVEGKSQQTIKEYLKIEKKLSDWFEESEGEKFDIKKVTTLHLHDFMKHLNENKYKPNYINKIKAALKTYFRYAEEKNIIVHNPINKVKMKRTQEQDAPPKWLSKKDLASFFHAIECEKNKSKKLRNMAICRLMSSAGLRVQEVTTLESQDICLEDKRENVTIREGKGGKFRIVPLNKDIVGSLNDWLDINNNQLNILFLSQQNKKISDRTIRYMVNKYAQNAGLKDVSPHTLRHTFCKLLVDQGVGLEQVAYLAGHDDVKTTMRYTKPSQNDLRKAVQKISDSK